MKYGSSAGLDGLSPRHLKQLTDPSDGEDSKRIKIALLEFTNLCLRGELPPKVRLAFFGARLHAFVKSDDGLRPIADGFVLRRLVAKIGCKLAAHLVREALAPTQVGVGVRAGTALAVHKCRDFVNANLIPEADNVLIKVDFTNAFNNISRAAVLQSVNDNIPGFLNYVRANYSSSSSLWFGTRCLQSAEGVQQGDPLGPMLFSLAIRKLTHSLESPFSIWYLDDGTLGGPLKLVMRDMDKIRKFGPEIGVLQNEKKCEFVISDGGEVTRW